MSTKRNGKNELNAKSKRAKVLNTRVVAFKPLIPPGIIQEEMQLSEKSRNMIIDVRKELSDIIAKKSNKVLCIVGPCSIHNYEVAIDYAKRLKKLSEKPEYKDSLLVVMRVYFEKPRTTVGWKGLINDPFLNGSFEINKGIRLARKILLEINDIGLPCAGEFLDAISPQFISDLVCWGAIGARTTESQIHRELASGLSCPIGFKNGTGGSIKVAVDAITSASNPHNFMGVNDHGLASIVKTTGNSDAHLVLRGGTNGPNFDKESIAACLKVMGDNHNGIVVDCSHANSGKKCENQIKVVESVAKQIEEGNKSLCGIMVESNIVSGKQSLTIGVTDPKTLIYGKSVTDECVDLETTEKMFNILSKAVLTRK